MKSGDVSEWAHKCSRCFCKVDACTSFYAAKWLFCQHLEQTHSLPMQAKKSRHPSIHSRGLRQQDHGSMNARILSNPHANQKRNEIKAFDQVKKKVDLKWDELEAQAQQMPHVKRLLLVWLTFHMLLGIIGIWTWGVGFIPQNAWAHLGKDENLVEII